MQVTVKNDAFPKGEALEIPGLGLVKVGEATDVTEAQVDDFRSRGFEFPEAGHLIIDQNPPAKPIASSKDSVGFSSKGDPEPIASTDANTNEGDN